MTKPAPTKRVPQTQKELAAWLKRQRGGKTQAQVAADASISERTVKRFEKEGVAALLKFLRYLDAIGVKLVPQPPLDRRVDAAAERIEQAAVLLERLLPQEDDRPEESPPPHGEA